MRPTRNQLIVGAALMFGVALAAQQPARDNMKPTPAGAAAISGKVLINGDTKQPARRVRVTLNDVSNVTPGQTTTTDDAGAFAFAGVPAGRFEVKAYKNAYLTGSYGASKPERAGTPIAVKDGDRLTGINVSIVRGGVITGVVRDAKGRPVPGITVRVLRFGYGAANGERTVTTPASGATTTDDRGEYRAYGLSPGTYLVLANPLPASAPPGAQDIRPLTAAEVDRAIAAARSGNAAPGAQPSSTTAPVATAGVRVNYAPVFFPGVTDIGSASSIVLGVSEEHAGADVTIQYVPTATISGSVTMPGGTLPQGTSIALVPSGAQTDLLAGAGLRGASTQVAPDGSYSFAGVAPGLYTVKARAGAGAGRGGASTAGPSMWAAADVNVSGQDLSVPLILQPSINVTGHVVFEGAQPSPAELQAMSFRLLATAAGGQMQSFGGGVVGADGRFTFSGLTPDAYRFFLTWPGATGKWTMASATANGRESFDAPLVVMPAESNGGVDLTITFTDTPTGVRGTFQDRNGRAATDYYVLAFPADRQLWKPGSRRIRMMQPGTDGAFSATGLVAGDYFLAALTDLEPGEWNDPQLLEQLAGAAIKISLRAGQITAQDIRIGGSIQ